MTVLSVHQFSLFFSSCIIHASLVLLFFFLIKKKKHILCVNFMQGTHKKSLGKKEQAHEMSI
jgi:hypothetical protein